MNRSFFAFGALLILLAAAMLAVSSTSRSTTVRPPAAASKSAVPLKIKSPPAIFVVILPAGEDAEVEDLAASAVQLVTSNPVTDLVPADQPRRPFSSLVGVQVELADRPADSEQSEENCRPIDAGMSHDDQDRSQRLELARAANLGSEEVVELFQSFGMSQPETSAARSATGKLPVRSGRWLFHFAVFSYDQISALLKVVATQLGDRGHLFGALTNPESHDQRPTSLSAGLLP